MVNLQALSVHLACTEDIQSWNRYVAQHAKGTIFHRFNWGPVIETVYGYKPAYLYAKEKGEVVGVLPLINVTSALTGRALISTAFTVGGGVLANDPEIALKLLRAAEDYARENNMTTVEVRQLPLHDDGDWPADWYNLPVTHAGFAMEIGSDDSEILKSIPRKRRAELRKALKLENEGSLSIKFDANPDRFYHLYARSLRDLGTPIFPKSFIEEVLTAFEGSVELLTVEYNGEAVSSLVSFYHGKKVYPYYIGAVPQARAVRAFDYTYWHQMCRASARGLSDFDFGRSRIDSGPYLYKKTWGLEPQPYRYRAWSDQSHQEEKSGELSATYRFAIAMWKRLPVPLATWGGKYLARHFA